MSNDATSLFRREALEARKAPWMGTVLLVPRPSHHLFALVGLAAAAGILALLFWGSYPRKVRVSGWLAPQGGLVQVYSPHVGVVTSLEVTEGAHVEKGQRLAAVSTDLESTAMGATGAQVARQLAGRKESLLSEKKNLERLAEQRKRSLTDRLEALEATETQLDSEIALQQQRIKSAHRSIVRAKALRKEGLASEEQQQTSEEGELVQVARMRELERSRLSAKRDRLTVQGELEDLPLKSSADIATLDRQISALEQELLETSAKREIVITAPESGTATALQMERGGHPDPKLPMLSIVPDGATLEAHLLTAGHAIGFLKPGQKVLLRYAAFPYQKFGHYQGTVASVSQSALSPTELTANTAGLAGTLGSKEPVYRVTVRLDQQTVRAFGESVALHPGMQLEADVVLESRRLVEWMLEPLYTITGTWKR